MPALRCQSPAVGVPVTLARVSERDLIVGKLAAFRHRRRLGPRIGFHFRRRMRGLTDIDRMNASDWRDHDVVLWG